MSKLICKICGKEFKPKKNQKRAFWAENWCGGNSGLLCPECHKAAKTFGICVADKEPPLGVVPWKSDIAKRSTSVPKEALPQMVGEESWRTWVAENRPEWL